MNFNSVDTNQYVQPMSWVSLPSHPAPTVSLVPSMVSMVAWLQSAEPNPLTLALLRPKYLDTAASCGVALSRSVVTASPLPSKVLPMLNSGSTSPLTELLPRSVCCKAIYKWEMTNNYREPSEYLPHWGWTWRCFLHIQGYRWFGYLRYWSIHCWCWPPSDSNRGYLYCLNSFRREIPQFSFFTVLHTILEWLFCIGGWLL